MAAVRAEAECERALAEARLLQLLDRTTALASLAEHEWGQLQQTVEDSDDVKLHQAMNVAREEGRR